MNYYNSYFELWTPDLFRLVYYHRIVCNYFNFIIFGSDFEKHSLFFVFLNYLFEITGDQLPSLKN